MRKACTPIAHTSIPRTATTGLSAFLQAQASAIILTDCFGIDTLFLKRLYVLLYMELATRRVIWFAVTEPRRCLGDPASQECVYERLRKLLADELGTQPAAETAAALQQVVATS